MKKIIFYCLAITIFLMTACKKMEISLAGTTGFTYFDIGTSNFYSAALDIIKLPVNRYFIYKDPATGLTDSVVVTQSNVDPTLQAATQSVSGYFYDVYSLTMEKFSGTTGQVWFKGIASCDYPVGSTPVHIIDSNFIFSDQQTNLPAFWYPLTSSGVMQYSLIPTLIIEGTNYSGVHRFFTTNGLQPTDANYLETTHYWVKGTGIIKKEVRTYNSVKTSLLVRFG